MERYRQSLQKIFTTNLRASSSDSLLILTDQEPFGTSNHPFSSRRQLAELAAETASELDIPCSVLVFEAQGSHGAEPPSHVWHQAFGASLQQVPTETLDAIIKKKATPTQQQLFQETLANTQSKSPYSLFLALGKYSISHTRFRNWLGEYLHVRAATMPGFEPALLTGVMNADWEAVQQRSKYVGELLSKAEAAELYSAAGDEKPSCLRLSLKGREGLADTGIIESDGDFGNLPGGEGFIAPLEKQAEGTFFAYTANGKNKMRIDVQGGRYRSCSRPDDPSIHHLEQNKSDPDISNLAELGVGTNEAARDTSSVLEGEKILGTCHIAFGDNKGFGGVVTAPFHRDYIIPDVTLKLFFEDGSETLVVDKGRFVNP